MRCPTSVKKSLALCGALALVFTHSSVAQSPAYVWVDYQQPKVNGVLTTDYENVGDELEINDYLLTDNFTSGNVTIYCDGEWQDGMGNFLVSFTNTVTIPSGPSTLFLSDSISATDETEHYFGADFSVASSGSSVGFSATDFALW